MSNLSEISVAILAGGFGNRLKPKVMGKPKVLAEVRRHPFLEYLLHQLDQANFKKIVLCTGYLSDQVEKTFGKRYKNLHLLYSPEQIPLGTAGSLRKAFPFLNSETILVMNGDSFYGSDLKKFWKFHLEKKAHGTILLKKVPDTARYGVVEVDEDGQIIRFQEKKETGGSGFINGGMYLFNRSMLLEIPENSVVSLEKDMFPKWIGNKLHGFKGTGRFIDIGTPESYKEAQEFFSEHSL